MAEQYFNAAIAGLMRLFEAFRSLALPIALLTAALLVSAALLSRQRGKEGEPFPWDKAATPFGYLGVFLLAVSLWSALGEAKPIARDAIVWQESAEAQSDPAPEAPGIVQANPVFATMFDQTYTRTLTLPPDFLQRIGADGVEALSPYLSDPTAENVSKLVDSFRRSGQDVVFTRELTRKGERPMAVDTAKVKVDFHRLQGQAYEASFAADYGFSNPTAEPLSGRFLMALPWSGGTIQGLSVIVDGQPILEPDARDYYVWEGTLAPGEKKAATVRYRSVGSGTWTYELGSSRRRVKTFELAATVDGAMQFGRGGILPTTKSANSAAWKMEDVVTSQPVRLSFPPDLAARDGYLQALSMFPATLVLLGALVLAVEWRSGRRPAPGQLALVLVGFSFGLALAVVGQGYLSPAAALFIGPVVGGILVLALTAWRYAPVLLPVALLPATALSPTHTSLWALVLAVVAMAGFVTLRPSRPSPL